MKQEERVDKTLTPLVQIIVDSTIKTRSITRGDERGFFVLLLGDDRLARREAIGLAKGYILTIIHSLHTFCIVSFWRGL
jgi:hypothetical protein